MKNWGAWFRNSDNLWKQGRFYRRSLLFIMAITCLPALLIGIAVNRIGVSQMEKSIAVTRENQVRQSVVRADDTLSQLERNTTQWAFNPVFGMKLLNLPVHYDYEHIREIIKTLFLLKRSNPLVSEAYLYMDVTGTIYSEEGGAAALEDEAAKARMQSLLTRPNVTYWLPEFNLLPPDQSKLAPALIYRLPVENGQSAAALIVYLDKVKLEQLISEPSADENSGSFLITDEGEFVVTTDASGMTPQEEALKQAVLGSGRLSDTFPFRWQGEEYSVSYSTFNRLGKKWIYISAVSVSKMTAPVVFASRLIYAVSIGGLLVGLLMSVVASRKLYEPVRYLTGLFRINRMSAGSGGSDNEIELIEKEWNRLTSESESLRERVERQLPKLREGFLLQLVQGNFYSWTEEEIRRHMQQLGWDMDRFSAAILFIQLHGIAKLSGRFTEGDRQLISYATSNIIEEAARSKFSHAEVINFQDLTAALFILLPADQSVAQIKGELNGLAEQLTQVLGRFIRMGITVCIGRLTYEAKSAPLVLEEARQTVKHRSLSDSDQILDVEDYTANEPEAVQYPFALETELIQAVCAGQEEQAVQALSGFCRELKRHQATQSMFIQWMLQLLGNVQFGLLKAGRNPYKIGVSADLHVELAGISEPDDAESWFRQHIIGPYTREVQQLVESHDEQHKLMIRQMTDLLHASYHQDISLEWCADKFGINPFTLSRIFKQETGVNFIDYLTRIRLDKSKQLLAETDCRINEIAERVGYQPTYFNRIFKKCEGITPSRYRQLYEKY
ncbi:helix-turn-helix domain-containing protein [Paenibacillus piri]|uniref:AraC family transcriptional regulator n=1 Tax=Paenibacillus piri TaxID=2547395 RepID=A0A4R5KGB0_9BACL|nr:helix-turn-helix domain-containing protein [Paenibacillus piri]TDF94052.1 AraC family transcriptional regulator [Paenibacillus piri]